MPERSLFSDDFLFFDSIKNSPLAFWLHFSDLSKLSQIRRALLVRCEHFGGFDAKILTCNILNTSQTHPKSSDFYHSSTLRKKPHNWPDFHRGKLTPPTVLPRHTRAHGANRGELLLGLLFRFIRSKILRLSRRLSIWHHINKISHILRNDLAVKLIHLLLKLSRKSCVLLLKIHFYSRELFLVYTYSNWFFQPITLQSN